MEKIKFKDITRETLIRNKDKELIISLDNEEFFIRLNLKLDSNNLVVFSNGAVNREKKSPPVYMRSSWAEEINASCIYIDDKTIHGG